MIAHLATLFSTEDTEVIVVYLVGHGITVNGNPKLLLKDAKTWKDSSDEKSVAVNYLLNELLTMKSSQDCFVLVMSDFCRSETVEMAQQKIAGTQARCATPKTYHLRSTWEFSLICFKTVGGPVSLCTPVKP